MGCRVPTGQAADGGGVAEQSGVDSRPRASKPGRRAKEKVIPPLGEVLVKTVRRFLPDFSPLGGAASGASGSGSGVLSEADADLVDGVDLSPGAPVASAVSI